MALLQNKSLFQALRVDFLTLVFPQWSSALMCSRHDRGPLEKDQGQEIRLKIWLNLGTSTVETSKYCKSELNRVYCL